MSYITQSLHRLVQRSPELIGSIDRERRRSWQTIREDVARFAGALRASGILEGDRVALLARNSDYYLDFLLGTYWAGAVINPVNTCWTANEIALSLEACSTKLLIVDAHFAPLAMAIRRAAPGLQRVIQIGDGNGEDDIEGHDDWLTWLRRSRMFDVVAKPWPQASTQAALPVVPRA